MILRPTFWDITGSRTSGFTVVGAVDGSTSTGAVVGSVVLLGEGAESVVSVSVVDTGGIDAGDSRSSGNGKSGLHDVGLL